jgi:lysyl endopeptidase
MRLAALTLVGVVVLSPVFAAKPGVVEVSSSVVTDGLTTEQEIQRQIELGTSLLLDLPLQHQQVRVALSPGEMAEIDRADRAISPQRIGIVKPIAPAITYAPAKDGGDWAVAISAESAGGIRLHIENLSLPQGVELYVYSRDGETYGPYTGTGPDGSGDLWTTSLFGSEAIVQVRGASSGHAPSFRITEAGVISPVFTEQSPAATNAFCGNANCIVDASCYSAANSIKDAYAKMEWVQGAFLYTCTGGLLNDTNPSSTNYFLTANHCLSKPTTAKNVSFYWRFRTSTCNGACPTNSGWPYKTTGAGVAASNRSGDFTLLTLNTAPPSGSVRLGFTNAPVANTNGVPLHRVSNPDFGPQVYNEQTVSTSAPTCQGWPRGERIYSHDTLGATDGGSSGSPVVNASDQVVGQLSGGCGTNVNDVCDAVHNATVDGALAFYWTSVQSFLAP